MLLSSFIFYIKIQIFYLILVNTIAFICFELVPLLTKKSNTISRNFNELITYQFGMSILSLIFGFLIFSILKVSNFDIGLIDISSIPSYLQIFTIYMVAEFLIFLSHLSAHKLRIPIISKSHMFHHKITDNMEWVNSKKEHPFIIFLFILVFCFVFYVLFRTDMISKILAVNIFIFLQALSHYSGKFTVPYIDKFFLFPKDHYNHHTKRSGPYGVTLSIYDTIFKTRD